MRAAGRGGGWSRVGGRRDSYKVGNTDGFIVTDTTLGTEPNDSLAYAPGLEIQHPIMSKLGDPGCRL